MPIFLNIGEFKFYTFGLFVILSVIIGILIIKSLAKKEHLKLKNIFDASLLIAMVGILAARATYFFLYRNQFEVDWQVFYFWQGGMVAYGGIVVGLIFSFWYLSGHHEDPYRWLDIITIGFLVAWAFGKYGCFMSGCSFDQSRLGFPLHLGYDWLELIEAVLSIALAEILYFIWSEKYFSAGKTFIIGLGGFALIQFSLGFTYQRQTIVSTLSFSQLFSIFILIICLIEILRIKHLYAPNRLFGLIWRSKRRMHDS